MKSKILAVLVSFGLLQLFAHNISCASGTASTDRNSNGVYHTVSKGQTLYRIAKTYDVSLDTLVRVNKIQDPAVITPGQRIFIPGATRNLKVQPAGRSSAPPFSFTFFPASGRIIGRFGAPRPGNRLHEGLDFSGTQGSDIRAVMGGIVRFSGKMGGYGNVVIIRHSNGYETRYGHNEKNLVKKGQQISAGDVIALVGSTGNARSPHVHFEIRRNGRPLDPRPFFIVD